MKAQYISSRVSQPWNYDPLRARPFLANMILKLLRSERPEEDIFGDPSPCMKIMGDVAVIELAGVIDMAVPDWIKPYGFGLTDALDIKEEVERATADENVTFGVYDVSSPGGLSLAGDLLYDVTEKANKKKPFFFFVDHGRDCDSTAYEAVASCTAGLAARFAGSIGCIGTYLPWLDDTKFWEDMGIKIEVFRSGEFKGMGIDALSERQKEYLQATVDRHGATFRRNVSKYRSGILREDMEGQWFEGVEAAKRGFVAGNADNLNAAIAKFRKMI
jgi:ClpP class serine protease